MTVGMRRLEPEPVVPRRSRRAVLTSVTLGAAGVTLATLACSTRTKQAGSPAAGAPPNPRRGGVFTYAGGAAGSYDTSGSGFDPTVQSQTRAKGYTLFYERLVAYNMSSYAIEPEL
ncbi:MAG TPA: hypothetical protein VK821_00980, partial [Dehalococcoidia bacterium]|nr:hypothetical protein [Dehalococcoidia bacterium]